MSDNRPPDDSFVVSTLDCFPSFRAARKLSMIVDVPVRGGKNISESITYRSGKPVGITSGFNWNGGLK